MAKKYVKMVLYAEPGVGKSTFASKAPNPFFICSDGNFGWLGLPDNQHVQISNGPQFEKIVDLMADPMFDWCDTVVVDLLEGCYLMFENSFCKKKKIETIGDLDYGKGYDITRKSFMILVSKLISLPKHVIFLMHGEDDISTKDVRGNVLTKHVPSSKLPKKLLSSVEGSVQYFLRAYIKAEPSTDPNSTKVYKKRYLSLIPKANDFGISRGADENNFPEDIELDWNVFAEVIGLNEETETVSQTDNPFQALLDGISDAPAKPAVATKPNVVASKVQTVVPPKTTATVGAKSTVTTTATKTVANKEPETEEAAVENEANEVVTELTLNKVAEEQVMAEEPKTASKVNKEDLLSKLKAKKAVEESKTEETVEETPVEEPKAEEPKKVINQSSINDKLAALKNMAKKK